MSSGDHRWFKASAEKEGNVTRDVIIIIIIIIIVICSTQLAKP
jgi:hypothetical protein